MKLRSAPLDEIHNEAQYVLGGRSDLESLLTVGVLRWLYSVTQKLALAALRRAVRRGL
jgi:hypothetical protein